MIYGLILLVIGGAMTTGLFQLRRQLNPFVRPVARFTVTVLAIAFLAFTIWVAFAILFHLLGGGGSMSYRF